MPARRRGAQLAVAVGVVVVVVGQCLVAQRFIVVHLVIGHKEDPVGAQDVHAPRVAAQGLDGVLEGAFVLAQPIERDSHPEQGQQILPAVAAQAQRAPVVNERFLEPSCQHRHLGQVAARDGRLALLER